MNNALLSIRGVSKKYEGMYALKGIDMDLEPGTVRALVGENGAGKSTLIKIICGIIHKDGGEISLNGTPVSIPNPLAAKNLGIQAVQQHFSLDPSKTVAENLFLNNYPRTKFGMIDWKKLSSNAERLLTDMGFSEVDPEARVSDISVADCQRVEVTKAVREEPRILILDEPSAVLPDNDVEKLFELIRKLKDKGIGIIYISHHMEEIYRIADRITVLKDGEVVCHIDDVNSVDKYSLVEKMVGRSIKDIYPSLQPYSSEVILKVKNLCTKYLNNISFELHRGEILGFAGLVGAGRTEVCRALFGMDRILSGSIELAGKPYKPQSIHDAIKSGLGFVTEDRHYDGLILSDTVENNIIYAGLKKILRHKVLSKKLSKSTAQHFIDNLRIATPSMYQTVHNLSGGNQQKVVLSKWLFIEPKILLLDEASRGIDVGAKREIYQLMSSLIRSGYSIIMVSSELLEVLKMSHRVAVMREGKILTQYNYGEANEEDIIRVASGL
jgi:ABC-type sugar transport system ATPase subunit